MPKALKIFFFYAGVTGVLYHTVFTTSSLYFLTVAKLDPLQLVLVGTAVEATIFIFEIPTGIVADVYSRRLSTVIGVFLIGLGFIVEGLWPLFAPLVLSQILWGIGYTFTSGAVQAWITDEIGEIEANPALIRSTQINQIGSFFGLLLGVVLGSIRLTLPIITSGALFILLGCVLILVMPEDGFHPTPAENRNNWQHMAYTFRQGMGMVRLRPALAGIFY